MNQKKPQEPLIRMVGFASDGEEVERALHETNKKSELKLKKA